MPIRRRCRAEGQDRVCLMTELRRQQWRLINAAVAAAGVFLPGGCGWDTSPPDWNEWQQLAVPDTPLPDDIGATVRIEGGTFLMGAPDAAEGMLGCPKQYRIECARPCHREHVPSFEIGKYKVTTTEFCVFLNELVQDGINPEDLVLRSSEAMSDLSPGPRLIYLTEDSWVVLEGGTFSPAAGYEWAPALVSYRGARGYCEWLGERTGETYRLPSEIEWEFAARGEEGRTYPWGEDIPVGRAYLWSHYRDAEAELERPTVRIGLFPEGATPEGVYDLVGLACEWCGNFWYDYSQDSIGDDPSAFGTFANALDPVRSERNYGVVGTVVRGGGYLDRDRCATANGWTRCGAGSPDLVGYSGSDSFRVLKEIRPDGDPENRGTAADLDESEGP
jgi:formylglycine-generating enzyme required for sulfatase activity